MEYSVFGKANGENAAKPYLPIEYIGKLKDDYEIQETRVPIVIWGIGPYCCKKIGVFDNNDVVAFVEREKVVFRGRQIILPHEDRSFDYDYIVALSSHYAEIIQEAVRMGIDHKKIIPGINCRPFLIGELEYISDRSRVEITSEGGLEYFYKEKRY